METKVILEHDEHRGLTVGADVRIMSANLQSQEWDGGEVPPRAEIFRENLLYYVPDVIGAQEVSRVWRSELDRVLANTDYRMLHPTLDGREYNYCPLIYNVRTVNVVESESYFLGPHYPRSVTWGIFEYKDSKKRFMVLNTHLDWTHKHGDFEATGSNTPRSREEQVRTIIDTLKEVEKKYGVPMMLTADWNTLHGRHPLNILTEVTGLVYSNDVARICKWPNNDVDYIFVSPQVQCELSYYYHTNVKGASDHGWGFADFKF